MQFPGLNVNRVRKFRYFRPIHSSASAFAIQSISNLTGSPYLALISNGLSQNLEVSSTLLLAIIFTMLEVMFLNLFELFGQTNHQRWLFVPVKDRIYNSRPFAVQLEGFNQNLLFTAFRNHFQPRKLRNKRKLIYIRRNCG